MSHDREPSLKSSGKSAGKSSRARSGQPSLQAAGVFVLRTPLLPFDELEAWSEGLEAASVAPHERAAALARDRGRLRERLRAMIARPEVREALFVASPSLEAQLEHWLADADSERGRKVERALVRYVQRMAGRATPFGLFGGCTVGEVGARTALLLAPRASYRRHTRLDMDHVVALTGALAADPELRGALAYRPNTSLYRAAGLLRYMEARATEAGRSYALVAVEPTDYLETVLEHGRPGARPDELAAALAAGDPDIDAADARDFVDMLIDRQILVPDLEPAVTGPEPMQALIAALEEIPGRADGVRTAHVLAGVRAALVEVDAGGLGASPERYRGLAHALAELPATPDPSRLFQVEMIKPAEAAVLGAEVVAEIVRGVEILRRMTPPRELELAQFRQRFEERYERREVPLMEALDEEAGIGFGTGAAEASPLLLGLDFGEEATAEPTSAWGARYALLQRKLLETARVGATEMVLDDGDLEALARADALPAPPGLAAMAVLAAPSAEAVACGAFRVYLRGARGPSAADLLTRFCHADARMDAAVRALIAAEEAREPDVIHAEIVHLPEGRAGNVLLRPVLRNYEIPYLGRAGGPGAGQIRVEDLVLSVVRGRLVLRSRRLQREIRPYSTSAISTHEGPSAHRFLAALARQGTASELQWSWGPLEHAPFLPRVSVGRLVLGLARWRLAAGELLRLAAPPGEPLFAAAQSLREQRGLPRRVALVEGDHLLPVDLDNALSIEAFAQLVKGRREAELVEMFAGPDELCVRGPEGGFVHELVVPLGRMSDTAPAARAVPRSAPVERVAPAVARRFPPGSEWLYAKLYGGPATADRVLRALIAPLVAEAQAAGVVDRWFFVRFRDPELHLRVRLHGPPGRGSERLWGEVLPQLHQAAGSWFADQRLWRLDLGTYEREVERYGGEDGIELAEQIFAADSDAALSLVARLAGDAGLDVRWRATLCGMDRLLRDLGLDLAARQHTVSVVRAGLGRILGVDAELERALGAKYRQEREAIEDLVAPALPDDHPLAGLDEIFGQRSARIAPVAAALRRAEADGRLTVPVATLAGELLHMHANRMLRGVALRQELVIYDLLARLYQARRARGRLD